MWYSVAPPELFTKFRVVKIHAELSKPLNLKLAAVPRLAGHAKYKYSSSGLKTRVWVLLFENPESKLRISASVGASVANVPQ